MCSARCMCSDARNSLSSVAALACAALASAGGSHGSALLQSSALHERRRRLPLPPPNMVDLAPEIFFAIKRL